MRVSQFQKPGVTILRKNPLPEETNMRKLIVLSAAALLAGALAGGVHATPLSAAGAMAMSGGLISPCPIRA